MRPITRRSALTRGAFALCAAVFPRAAAHAQTVGPVMSALSGHMGAAKRRALPPDVAEEAKHHILDTFAATLSGSELPRVRAALAWARAQAGRAVSTRVG